MKCLNCGNEFSLEPTVFKCPACGAEIPNRSVHSGALSFIDKQANKSESPLGTFTVVVAGEYIDIYKKSAAKVMLMGAAGFLGQYGKLIFSFHKSEITEIKKNAGFLGKVKSFTIDTQTHTVTFTPGGSVSKNFVSSMDDFAANIGDK